MHKQLLYLLLIFLQSSLFANPEEIIIHLPAEKQMLPLYLAPALDLRSQQHTNDPYMKELQKTLKFDLEHGGMLKVVPQSQTLNLLCTGKNPDEFESSPLWQQQHIIYVLRATVDDQSLSARLFMTASGLIKGIDNLPLTAELAIDRKQIHRLSDLIHKTLFGKEGIASTHTLFTYRYKKESTKVRPPVYDSDIWEMDYDGHNMRQITKDPGYCVTPTYVPSQGTFLPNSLLYVSYRTGQSKIYQHSLRGRQEKKLLPLRGNQMMPTIAPTRNYIAFISDAAGSADLFIQEYIPEQGALGKPQQLFQYPNATQASPCFSPNGKQIAFVSNMNGSPRIYILNIPKKNSSRRQFPKLITRINRENTAPSWSPDGTKIAYSAKSGKGTRQIWIYNLETQTELQLTSGKEHKENPTWAPNSLHLIFSMGDETQSDLYLINLNQKNAVKLTSGHGLKVFPEWEPKYIR